MPSWLKLLLSLLGTGALGLALLVGGGIWWVRKNKDRLVEDGRVAQAEGKAFGTAHARGECIDDAFTRVERCGPMDLVCMTGVRLRLDACVPVAEDDGACKDVPARAELIKVALWSNKECARRGQAGSQACQNLIQGVIEVCEKGKH